MIAYERLADHLVAQCLLDQHFDATNPAAAFAEGGALEFLAKDSYVPSGLIEAVLIQTAERTGRELLSLAPKLEERWAIGDTFRQSVL